MIRGDPGIEDIYKWTEDGQNTPMRGKTGTGDGVHILTGPIYVCGAEPGDVLQVGGCMDGCMDGWLVPWNASLACKLAASSLC